ncbi:hypothetical protein [Streptomyces sp. PU-14G]|uniref:hypothetical protein n=1 Tax=Streptomyces sp. PU-14G TaxID=2800808 RepID=UPI0034DF7264
MTTWGLVREASSGAGQHKYLLPELLGHFDGTREEALAELRSRARRYEPSRPWNPKRRRLFRERDGYLLVVTGSWESFCTRFSVAELVEDSDAPQETAVSDRTVPEPEPAPAPSPERYTDGVPVKPAWLGRTDLP